MGKLKDACAAVASYLIFYPDDDTMLENKKYYLKQPKAQEEYFQPREVINILLIIKEICS